MKKKFLAALLLPAMLFAGLSGCGEPEKIVSDSLAPVTGNPVTERTDSTLAQETIREEETTAAEEQGYSFDATEMTESTLTVPAVEKDGVYTTKEDVALYLYTYGVLPSNFITKKEAQELGWEGGSLEPYAPGKCIGGSNFGNYEELLPKAEGRKYYECDIDTLGKSSRGAKRLVYSNDGLIYYTEDHYKTFDLLYGGES